MNLKKILKKIESEDPAIGISTAAATSGMLATSLIIKVANKSKLEDLKKESKEVKKKLKNLIQEDEKAYRSYMNAYKSKDEKKVKQALKYAIETPLKIAEQSYKIMELAEKALENGKKSMILEAYGATLLGRAAIESAIKIIDLNLLELKDEEYDNKIWPKKHNIDVISQRKKNDIYIKLRHSIYNF